MGATDFWDNQDRAKALVGELKIAKAQTEPLSKVVADFEDAKLAYEMSREEGDEDLLLEADTALVAAMGAEYCAHHVHMKRVEIDKTKDMTPEGARDFAIWFV